MIIKYIVIHLVSVFNQLINIIYKNKNKDKNKDKHKDKI